MVLTTIDCLNSLEKGSSRRFPKDMEVYETFFRRYKQKKDINVLEIGVEGGGGLYCWRKYFPNACNIVGIDMHDECKKWEDINQKLFVCIGNQMDENFLKNVNNKYGPFDIIIDDGGHRMEHHKKSFNILFPLLKMDGLYCIEDLHTSYWPNYGGGINVSTSTINVFKKLIDALNFRGTRESQAKPFNLFANNYPDCLNYYEKYLYSLSFYESVIIAHKKEKEWIKEFPMYSTKYSS